MKIKVYLNEIKYRLFFLFLNFLINISLLYFFKEQLIFLLSLSKTQLFSYFISTNMTEIFFVFFKLSFYLSLYFSFPFILCQFWFFIVPALYKYEYKVLQKFFIASLIIFLGCTYLTPFKILPYCWEFFSSFQLEANQSLVSIQMELRIKDFLDFFLTTLFSLIFISNLFLIFLNLINLFPIYFFIKFRKIFYFSILAVATFCTPPDVLSQVLTAFFMILIYESFLFTNFLNRKYKNKKGE